MAATMFYMKALNLDRQTKLFSNGTENAQNAVENYHCFL
jgi:hypothetical protein